MCTVSFLPVGHGFILAMNRDEQKSRGRALAPEPHQEGRCLYPSEENGGTWIGVNETALAFALINWNEKPQSAGGVSRGSIIPRLLAARNAESAAVALADLKLAEINPFRLIAISREGRSLTEWRWDGGALEARPLPWQGMHWFSSALDEAGVSKVRAATVAATAAPEKIEDLRALHRTHVPARNAYAICMHREDAVTVSYTEMEVKDNSAVMRYAPGAPCEQALGAATRLALRR